LLVVEQLLLVELVEQLLLVELVVELDSGLH
jgi:hypothetical protein